MLKNKLFSVIKIINIAVFILTFAIAFTILFRPFYYFHIDVLNLAETTGYSVETIKTAYNEMLDFCIGISSQFSTGELAFSQEGMSHFADCRVLFIIDFALLISSGFMLSVLHVFHKKKMINYHWFYGHRPSYFASVGLLMLFTVVGLVAAMDFDRAFVIFHMLFFPGKDNWLFNPKTDEIISILPEQYFADCGILIIVIIIGMCLFFIIKDIKERKKIA